MKNRFFILLITLLCGILSFSQDITIVGGTVKCPAPLAVGYSKTIVGKTYYVVDSAAISSILSTGSFSVGASTMTPTDLSCVCTTQITSMEDMFKDQTTFNDDISNWDTSNVTNMQQMFMGTASFTININSWDVSSVTDMDGMFRAATSFNQPLNSWIVSNVLSMSNMFREASAFNQPLNSWDVSNVRYMQYLFKSTIYNQPLNNWDVSGVKNMQEMFMGSDFNQPINNWDVGSVTNMSRLFRDTDFNHPLNSWTVSNVTTLSQMFMDNDEFDQPLDNWNLSSATNISHIFRGCLEFDQPLNTWNTSPSSTAKITNMIGVFLNARKFNQPLDNWDVSKVTRMDDMFLNAFVFNGDIDSWTVSNVTSMHEMFRGAKVFDRNISGWTITSLENISGMFWDALEFTQNINSWDVSSVTNMNNTFRNADKFNQPLNNWDTSSVRYMSSTFKANNLFNQDLTSWVTSSVEHMQYTFMNNTVFNNGQSSAVSNTLQWDTSSVERMDGMFENATAFNGNISGWNVSGVTQMDRMFFNAVVFNQDLSNWNTSSVTTLQGMFAGAAIFNNGLSAGDSSTIMNWNTSNVTTIESTFASATAFNGNISSWDVSNVTRANNLFNGASKFNQPLGGWDVTSINTMNNMFASASLFDQDLNCWCVVHNPSRSSFSNSSPINSKSLFLPRWAEPCNPSISFSTSVISQDDSPISPTIISSGGTFTASITGGIVHRVNQWGSGRADFLDINATTGEINPTTSLSGVYDITYSTGACKSFTTSITIRSVNNPLNQLSYTSSSVCKSIGGTLTPTIIPTNSHATVPRIYIDPGNPISYPNIGNAPNGETIVNLTTNSGFTHWEDGVVADVSGNHPNYMIMSDNNGVVHKPGYSWELLPGATENNFITDQGGDRGYFPRESSSISMWVKESSWSSTTFLFDYTNGGDRDGKMWLSTINPSGELRWHIKTGARKKLSFTAADIETSAALAYGVFSADMDGDGDMDIVSASNNDDTIAWYENNGDANPTWTANDVATDADGANSVFAADMDGDGDMDIVSSSANDNTIAWYENDGNANPTWAAADIATSANSARSVFVADMDGDGDMDIVSASYNDDTIAWYENNGDANPTWAAADIATSADGALSVYAADMDGDGDMDIVSASMRDNTIAWYENDGNANPTWAAVDISTSAAGASGVYAADMDGDGDMDIVSADFSDNTIAWYENNGDANPTWVAADISTSAAGARDVHVADMDGDGDMDIVSADFSDNTIAWYENNGDANPTWTAANIVTSANAPHSVFAADMDGDGDMDIVSADSGDNTIAWYESVITYGQVDNVNSMTNNNWHHLVMTRDESGNPAGGGIVKLYIDGVLTSVDYGTPTGALATPGDVIFGRNQHNQSGVNGLGKFTGEFGPIRIFAHELTQSEIEYEYDMFALRYKPDSFTATPAGLSINATTGIIDVSNSSGGIYRVTASWTESTSGKVHTATHSITIKDPDASFSYSSNSFCQGDVGFVDPTITDAGGSFTASPSGLKIDSTSGRIIPDTSTPGNYIIEYSLVDCSATSSLSMEIRPQDVPTISYTSSGSCKNVDPSISLTPALSIPGGSFTSSPPGLNINSATGVIIPNLSQTGTYTIDYITNGVCPGEASVLFVIYPILNSNFNYAENSYSRSYIGIVTPTINTIGGRFSSSPAGLDINSSNGEINPSLSNIGTYNVMYNNGLCSSTTTTLTVNKIVPTIFSEIVTKTYGDPDFSISAISSSTGTFSFQVIDTNVASNTGTNSITITGVGTTTIKINQTADANFSTASKTITLYVRKADPNIILSNIVTRTYGDPDFNLTATSSSTGLFSFNALDSSVASISGNTVSIAGAGTTTIIVSQVSDVFYNATSSSLTLIVYKADPIIHFPDVTKTYGDPDFSISAISSSTGTFSFQVIDTNVASNTGTNSITITGVGTTTIKINQTADANFSTASKTITLYVRKADPNIILSNIVTRTYGDPDFNLTATSSSTGLFSFNALDSSVASISGNTVSIAGAGTTTIIVSQVSDVFYNATSSSLTLIVYKADPIIHFPDVTKTYGDPDFSISAISSSTGTFSFQVIDTNVASNTGTNSITITGVGTTTIKINQTADANFSTASKTITLYVRKADPNIILSNIVTRTYGDPDFNLTATSSSTGLFSFNALDSSVASISGNTVSIAGAGTTTIIVSQVSDVFYNATSSSLTLIVYKADPIIHFPDVTKTYGDPDFSISAISSSTGDFAYSIDDLRIASIVSSIGNTTTITNSISARASNYGTSTRPPLFISIEKAGSTSITAVQAEDYNYNSVSASMNLSILKKDLSVSVWYPTSTITRTFGIPPFEILLPNVDLNYNGVFNFRSSDSSIASISSRTLTINSIGTVSLFADMSADGNYNEKTVTVTLVVKKANQSIIVEPFALVKPLKDFSSFTVSATSTSGAPVVISLDPGSAAILSGTVGNYSLTNINQTGLVTITFTTDPSAHPNYNSATVTLVIDVVKTNQNITVSPEPPKFIYFEENLTYKINAFSDSSLNVDYRITSGTNAILNGDTLEIHDIGELEVEISQSGNNSFNPAVSRSYVIKVLQGMTILSNFNIPDKLIIDSNFIIPPPTSNRPGLIKYISSNPNIAEIVGDQIIIKGIGSCTISAIQPATPRFTSASISTIFIVNDTDCDSDGIGDTIDLDDDNDGILDIQELINGTDPCALDTDNDFLSDGDENDIGTDPLDNDSDNDGVIDGLDDFPLDPNESVDTDDDGIGDNSDDDANGDGFLDDEIFVSGLVTPGVRGNEATWKVMNIQNYPGSKVSIYDRNGLQVFKQINYKNDWAGTFKQTGDLLPAGSYYYIIEVSQNNRVIQGWLYLTY